MGQMNTELEQALERIKTEYIESSGDRLDEIDATIDRMYRGEGDRGADFFEMQRTIHSIKGSAGTHGLHAVSIIAHRMEDYFQANQRLSGEQFRDVQIFVDRMRDVFEAAGEITEAELDLILSKLPASTDSDITETESRDLFILLVMASGLQRNIVSKELTTRGFELSFAETPVEAFALALSLKPNLIVSSAEFELLNGIEFAQVLKSVKATAAIPYILMTSSELDETVRAGLPGGTMVVRKTANFAKELTERINEL